VAGWAACSVDYGGWCVGASRRRGWRLRLQLLQLIQVARQFGLTCAAVLLLPCLGDGVFLSAGPLGQGQAVGGGSGRGRISHFCLYLSTGLAGTVGLGLCRRHGRQPLSVFFEVSTLCHDQLACFGRIQALNVLRGGQVEYHSGFESVHVAIDKGLRVGTQQTDQHLLQGGASGFVLGRNATRRVATHHVDPVLGHCPRLAGVAGSAAVGRCRGSPSGHLGGTTRQGGRCRGVSRSCCGRCADGAHGRWHGRRCGARAGWVDQQCVASLQLAAGPVRLQHHIQEGFADGAGTAQAQHRTAVWAAYQLQTDVAQQRIEFKTGCLEAFWGGDHHFEAGSFFRAEAG